MTEVATLWQFIWDDFTLSAFMTGGGIALVLAGLFIPVCEWFEDPRR
jgi:hypothetical protein